MTESYVFKEKIAAPLTSARFRYTMTTIPSAKNTPRGEAKPEGEENKNSKDDKEEVVPTVNDTQLDDDGLCTICYSQKANTVLLDCGHGGICIDCATDTMRKNNHCLFCRQRVIQIIEIQTDEIKKGLYKVVNSYFVSDGTFP